MIQRYILVLSFILLVPNISQAQDVDKNSGLLAKNLPCLSYLQYNSGINYGRIYNYDTEIRKKVLRKASDDITQLGSIAGYGLIGAGAYLSVENGWNVWVSVPIAAVLFLATMYGSSVWSTSVGGKAESLSMNSSVRKDILFHYNVDSSVGIYIDGINHHLASYDKEVSPFLNNLLFLYEHYYTKQSVPYADCLTWCSMVCSMAGDNVQAARNLKLADSLFHEYGTGAFDGRDTLNEILRLDTKSIICFNDESEVNAIHYAKRSTNLKKKYFGEDSDTYLMALLNLSHLYAERLQYKKSQKYHNIGFNTYVELIKREFCSRSESDRSIYWTEAYRYIGHTIDLAFETSNKWNKRADYTLPSSLYDAQLLSKGLLLNTTRSFESFVRQSENTTAVEMLELRKTIKDSSSSPATIDSLDLEILKALKYGGKPFQLPHLSVTWRDVAQKLNNDDLAIEFFKNGDNLYGAVLLKKRWKSPKIVVLNNIVDIDNRKIMLHDALQCSFLEKNDKHILWNIGKSVWGDEIIKHFPKTDNGKVYFSTDGKLQTMGIEYLPFVKPTDTSYYSISDLYNLQRLSSTRYLVTQDSYKGSNGSAVFGGLLYGTEKIPYLKGSLIEANNITRILQNTTEPEFTPVNYTLSKGTKTAFKFLGGKEKRVIHLATHGFFQSQTDDSLFTYSTTNYNPLNNSGLYMATERLSNWEETNNNIILTSQEIAQVDLHGVEMAVLSACETGQGIVYTDGVFGLQRGFKMAGVQSLLMSLWKVDDLATQMLMTQFYENWLVKKMPKQKALKEAQAYVRNFEIDEIEWAVELRKQRNERGGGGNFRSKATTGTGKTNKSGRMIKPFQDPKYWAAFILLDGLD